MHPKGQRVKRRREKERGLGWMGSQGGEAMRVSTLWFEKGVEEEPGKVERLSFSVGSTTLMTFEKILT